MDNAINKIKKALLVYDMAEQRAIDRIVLAADEPSTSFYEELDRRKNEIFERKAKHTSLLRVAIIAAIIISLTAVVAVATRGKIVDFFVELWEDHLEINYDRDDDNDDVELAPQKSPAVIPDGYTLDEERVIGNGLYCRWTNGDLEIVFMSVVGGDGSLNINTEGDEYGEVKIGEYKGYYSLNYGVYSISWFDEDRNYTLSVPEGIGLEEGVRIAESVK